MMTIQLSARKAPYASVKAFSEILKRIRELQLKRIDADTLTKWGYQPYDGSSVVSAFRFLNLISKDGATTSDYLSIKSDSTYQMELKRIVEQAYHKVFEIHNHDLSSVSKKDLVDTIILNEVYPDTAKQTAGKAAGLFIWLCTAAGIETAEEQLQPTKTTPKLNTNVAQRSPTRKGIRNNIETRLTSRINVNVNIDVKATEDEIYSVLLNARSAVQRIENEGS